MLRELGLNTMLQSAILWNILFESNRLPSSIPANNEDNNETHFWRTITLQERNQNICGTGDTALNATLWEEEENKKNWLVQSQ